jgi:hypothetical protein
MKKLLFLFPLLAFSGNSISLKKDKVDQTKQIINNVYQYIEKSNLPHQEVIQIEQSLKTAYDNLSDTTK